MAIYGTEGMNGEQLYDEIHRGGRFVVYQYAVSLLVITFRRGSDIYFIKAGKSAVAQGLPYTFLSLLLGWWGFPWGIIYTIESIVFNCAGVKDVTQEVLSAIYRETAAGKCLEEQGT